MSRPGAGGGRQGRRHRQGSEPRVSAEDAAGLARICALNALAAAADAAGGLENIRRIVKWSASWPGAPGFNGQPQVINGERAAHRGARRGRPARPQRRRRGRAAAHVPVEVELIAEARD